MDETLQYLVNKEIILQITKSYRGVKLIAIVAKVYNGQCVNHIRHEVRKILYDQNDCRRNWSKTSKNLVIRQIIKQALANSLKATV